MRALWVALLVSLSSCTLTKEPTVSDLSSRVGDATGPPRTASCNTASVEELEYELWCHTLQATRLADKSTVGYVRSPPREECYELEYESKRRRAVGRMSIGEVKEYLRSLHGRRPAVLFHAENDAEERFCTWLLTADGVAASEAAPLDDTFWSLGSGLSIYLDLSTGESGRVAEPRGVVQIQSGSASLVEVARRLLPPKVARGLIDRQVETLIVVPIYDVGAVPFAALPLDGKRLIEHMSVLIAPSFQSFEASPISWQGEPVHPLVLGDPTSYVVPALGGALREAREVAGEVGAQPLVHGHATAAAVGDWLRTYPDTNLIHIAAHGIAESLNADARSGVYLHESELADARSGLHLADGFWSAEDVWSLELAPGSLVVLSACQSGLGRHFEMGTASVARAFHQDGASSVVMSLWNVEDEATRKLMVAFTKNAFSELRAVPPDRALRQAMLELRKTDPDPLHWAGFNVFGLPALD